MRKIKMRASIILTIGCLSVSSIQAFSFTDVVNLKQNAQENSVKSTNWKIVLKGVKWILQRADSSLFYRTPTNKEGENWIASSSGSVNFGSDAQRVKIPVTIKYRNMEISMFAQTNFTNWLSTIAVFAENSSGTQVVGNNVQHDQHVFYENPPLGTYNLYYVGTKGQKWDCWVYVFNFGIARSTTSGKEFEYIIDSNEHKGYIVPSVRHKRNLKTYKSNVLNGKELCDEFYDSELGVSVNSLRNFEVGDSIIFNDIIKDIEYQENIDTTILRFDGNFPDEKINWPFKGDLTNRFKVGDTIKLNFQVLKEFEKNGIIFENLDYILEGYKYNENGNYPCIDDYIIDTD